MNKPVAAFINHPHQSPFPFSSRFFHDEPGRHVMSANVPRRINNVCGQALEEVLPAKGLFMA